MFELVDGWSIANSPRLVDGWAIGGWLFFFKKTTFSAWFTVFSAFPKNVQTRVSGQRFFGRPCPGLLINMEKIWSQCIIIVTYSDKVQAVKFGCCSDHRLHVIRTVTIAPDHLDLGVLLQISSEVNPKLSPKKMVIIKRIDSWSQPHKYMNCICIKQQSFQTPGPIEPNRMLIFH